MNIKKRYLLLMIAALLVVIFTLMNQKSTVADTVSNEMVETEVIEAKEIISEFEDYDSSQYSIESPYINVDAYGMNPLSAYVIMPIDKAASFSYTVQGIDDSADYTFTTDELQSESLVIPVIGLYASFQNTVDITINYQDGTTEEVSIAIETGAVADYVTTKIDVDTSSSSVEEATGALDGGFIFDNRINGYDINGDVRVAMEIEDLDWQGNALRINDDGTFMMGTMDYIYNISITGRVLFEYKSPDGYYMNHDYMSAEDGNTYVILSPDEENMTYTDTGLKEEGFVAVYETGVDELPTQIFDINKLVVANAVNAVNTFSTAQDELVHLNAIAYDEYSDTIMLSAQSQNAIIAINPQDGSLKWIIKDADDVITNSELTLDVIGDFEYTNGQHSINITTDEKYDDGDESTIELTVYNNKFCLDWEGNAIVSTNGGYEASCASQNASSLLVYRIDTEENTVEMLDSFEVPGYYSSIRSSWFQSEDYAHNYITYGDMGQMIATDEEFNILFSVQSDEADAYYQNMYRARVISGDQLETIELNAL